MTMRKLQNIDAEIRKVLPNATWGEDNEGQLVIYTNIGIVTIVDGEEWTIDMDEI